MKLLLCALAALLPTVAVGAFSVRSSFTNGGITTRPRRRPSCVFCNKKNAMVMYDSSHDPPSSPEHNAWTVLSKTEKWISSTLQGMNGSGAGGGGGTGATGKNSNPYARKEVSYACETGASDTPMVVANIFRRLKEVRQMGERHGQQEEERRDNTGASSYEPSTLRQTEVVVVPGNEHLDKYAVFDQLVNAVNQARRNARDYVTDVDLERLDNELDDDEEEDLDWSVSVNLAHLHPKFGELTPQQELEQLQQEEEDGEVDVNLQQYKEKRLMARRSPYPTVVIEVRAVPPPDFGRAPPPPPHPSAAASSGKEGESAVTSADIQKLEALFGKSAHVNHPTADLSPKDQENAFYDSIGNSITEISSVTPLNVAQTWVAKNDPDLALSLTAAFTESDTKHVDEAYQFIFTNVAMLMQSQSGVGPQPTTKQQRQYLVMPHFLSSSATSFEKFSNEVQNMINALPDLKDRASIETYHPEHVDPSRRSPLPIYVLIKKE